MIPFATTQAREKSSLPHPDKEAAGFTTTSEGENESLLSFFLNAVGANPASFKKTAGFTLIEVMVSIAVIGIVAGMFFVQREGFSRSVNLNNVAHEVALAVRQAQSYGISSRGSDLGDDYDDFSHGIYFDTDSPGEFVMYRNTQGNPGYQSGDEEVETYQLPPGMEIVGVCRNSSFGDTSCSPGSGELVIMFSRPHPDAQFRRPNSGNSLSGQTAVILIEEDSGSQRSVVVYASGFITVE